VQAASLVLASGSPIRRQLLARLGLPFTAVAANIEEQPRPGETPAALVRRLSCEKAAALQGRYPDAVIIGSDQLAVFDGKATSKPGNADRAARDLRRFSGQAVEFLTGLCVLEPGQCSGQFVCQATTVVFRNLSDAEIQRYIERDAPLDCAGAFRLEALGPALFERVESKDPTALLGLPLISLCGMLRSAGLQVP
jgi:MAF protein